VAVDNNCAMMNDDNEAYILYALTFVNCRYLQIFADICRYPHRYLVSPADICSPVKTSHIPRNQYKL
jgi:hypothetical protein